MTTITSIYFDSSWKPIEVYILVSETETNKYWGVFDQEMPPRYQDPPKRFKSDLKFQIWIRTFVTSACTWQVVFTIPGRKANKHLLHGSSCVCISCRRPKHKCSRRTYLQIYILQVLSFHFGWRSEGLHGRVEIGSDRAIHSFSNQNLGPHGAALDLWMQGPLCVLSELKPAGCCRAVRSDSTQLRGADVVRPCIASGPWVSGLPLALPA